MSAQQTRAASAVVRGVGGYVPPRVVTNDELSRTLDTSDDWIRSRTGIHTRHVVETGTATSDLAVEAGRRALDSAGLDSVDLVIVATSTPDYRCPATAPEVANRLGLGTIPAFDLAAVCSGFVYALAQASASLLSGQVDSVLVIGADTFSTIVDPTDRTNAVIFGDGAGAVVLTRGDADEKGAVGGFVLASDGSRSDLIKVRSGGSRATVEDAPEADRYFAMDGRGVFAVAVAAMADASRQALSRVGWSIGDVDWLVAHQANKRILSLVAASLELPGDSAVVHLDRVGNTSAASIPLALAAHGEQFALGDRILLTAFGGGATWGACTLTWPGVSTEAPSHV